MARYDNKTPDELRCAILCCLYLYGSEHELSFSSGLCWDDEIWTQIGGSEENTGEPSVNFKVYKTKIEAQPPPEESAFKKTWKLKDYDLTSKKGFNQLVADINAYLIEYYGQWTEQPRFVKKSEVAARGTKNV